MLPARRAKRRIGHPHDRGGPGRPGAYACPRTGNERCVGSTCPRGASSCTHDAAENSICNRCGQSTPVAGCSADVRSSVGSQPARCANAAPKIPALGLQMAGSCRPRPQPGSRCVTLQALPAQEGLNRRAHHVAPCQAGSSLDWRRRAQLRRGSGQWFETPPGRHRTRHRRMMDTRQFATAGRWPR